MVQETEFPDGYWCRDGWGCLHFLIRDFCQQLDNNKLKSEEDKLTFERHLGLLKAATAKLEEMLLPFVEQNTPISEMPCHFPNSVSWGRYCCQKNLAKLEVQREKEKSDKTIKSKISKKSRKKK